MGHYLENVASFLIELFILSRRTRDEKEDVLRHTEHIYLTTENIMPKYGLKRPLGEINSNNKTTSHRANRARSVRQ